MSRQKNSASKASGAQVSTRLRRGERRSPSLIDTSPSRRDDVCEKTANPVATESAAALIGLGWFANILETGILAEAAERKRGQPEGAPWSPLFSIGAAVRLKRNRAGDCSVLSACCAIEVLERGPSASANVPAA